MHNYGKPDHEGPYEQMSLYIGMCTFYFFTMWYNTDTDKMILIRYQTIKTFTFFLLAFWYTQHTINSIQGPQFSKWCKNENQNMHLKKKNLSFLCQTSSILINIIIKRIVKSIVYLSFQYDTSISFMILIWYDTSDMVQIPICSLFFFFIIFQCKVFLGSKEDAERFCLRLFYVLMMYFCINLSW